MIEALKGLFGGGGNDGFTTLTESEFQGALREAKKPFILDVRAKHEFDSLKIPNAFNLDVQHPAFVEKIKHFDKDRPYFVYCQSGRRSVKACKKLVKEGFRQVFNLKGGISQYMGKVV